MFNKIKLWLRIALLRREIRYWSSVYHEHSAGTKRVIDREQKARRAELYSLEVQYEILKVAS